MEKGHQKRKTFLEKMSTEQKEDFKRKDRERKRAKRQEEKLRKIQEVSTPYKTSAALGKARARVAKALPSNPLRAQEVVDSLKRILDNTVGPKVEVVQEEEVPRALKLTPEVRNRITTFYYRQDISVTFPGKKDYVMVKALDGKRRKMVKHVLVLTLREAHSEFSKEETDLTISLDAFAKLRPPNVLLRHCQPKNVCVCRYHANVQFLISALHSHDADFPLDHRALFRATTCSPENLLNESCQQGACEKCIPLGTITNLLKMLGTSEVVAKSWYVKYLRWEEEPDDKGKVRLRKNEKYDSLYSILQQLADDWQHFKVHNLVKKHQDLAFNKLHARRINTSVLVQFDFSENAEIMEQDKVQGAHWWHL